MATSLVLADVHSNLPALQAVLQDAGRHAIFDTVLVLGDVVGYGAEPNECIERLRDYPCVIVAGNHDLGSVGPVPSIVRTTRAGTPATTRILPFTSRPL